jgi:hypothetical protein
MADFLARVAARTLGLSPIVEPLMDPLFAGTRMMPHDETPDASQFGGGGGEPVAGSLGTAPARPRLAPLAGGAWVVTPTSADIATAALVGPARQVRGAHARPADATSEDTLGEADLAPADADPAPSYAPPATVFGGRDNQEATHRGRGAGAPAWLVPRRVAPAAAASAHVPTGPTERRSTSGKAGPRPVVRVTIGRVDVRAVLAPQLPAPVPPAGPRLTLDDYAQQRREGRR